MAKKCLLFCFIACVLLSAICTVHAVTARANAQSEIAMELTTGKILHEQNAEEKLPMASTTKILTAIIIIEDCNLDEIITVPDEAVGCEGSSIYLKKDEEISVIDLLYGLMLRSGNDSAAALAIYHSGSVEKFAEAMNRKAEQIGATNSNFTNPSGLPDENHYTTAKDLCRIACYAMKNDTFRKIVSTKSYRGDFRSYENKNKMLESYSGANGIKTGYTLRAGRCLVSSAERDGMDVICVVLNCPEMYERSKEILNYCFSGFKLFKIKKNAVFMSDRVLCKTQNDINFIANINEKIDFKVNSYKNPSNIKIGDLVAKLEILGENGLILSENLYSIEER